MNSRALPALVCLYALACEAPATRGVPRTDVSVEEFGQLRWLAGTWRGSDGDAYERYVVLDDSTIAGARYADSALVTLEDSVVVTLRNAVVRMRVGDVTGTLTAIAGRAAVFWPENDGNGWTVNTGEVCVPALAAATAPCNAVIDRGGRSLRMTEHRSRIIGDRARLLFELR